jgi:hypothetical protein
MLKTLSNEPLHTFTYGRLKAACDIAKASGSGLVQVSSRIKQSQVFLYRGWTFVEGNRINVRVLSYPTHQIFWLMISAWDHVRDEAHGQSPALTSTGLAFVVGVASAINDRVICLGDFGSHDALSLTKG